MQHVDDREDSETTGITSCFGVQGNTSNEAPSEGQYGGSLPPTIPRLHAEADRRRAWPVAADCSESAETGYRVPSVSPPDHRAAIVNACDDLKAFLLEKNRAYGNSALEPINIFSKLPAVEGLLVRIDDKLKRIRNGQSYPGDNDLKDLVGYLVLLMIILEMEQ